MRYTREEIVNLRKKMIKLLPEKYSKEIGFLTEALIDNPTMVSVETDFRELKKYVKRKVTHTGHGAFGEPESDVDFYVNGMYVSHGSNIFLDGGDVPIRVSSFFNIKKILEDLLEAHNNTFSLES